MVITMRVVNMGDRVVKEATLDVSQLPTGSHVLQLQGEQLAEPLMFIKQ